MKKNKLLVANWKMNKLLKESLLFFDFFKEKEIQLRELQEKKKLKVIISPSQLFLKPLEEDIKQKKLPFFLAAQNCCFEKSGAYTGEISYPMLQEVGVEWIIIGHSERRKYFNETDNFVNKKLKLLLENNFKVIVCIGEDKLTYENKKTKMFLQKQLLVICQNIREEYLKNLVVAYEPIFAIGTGIIPEINELKEIILFIRKFFEDHFASSKFLSFLKVLYGGSVDASNFKLIMQNTHVDGFLVGNYSLKPQNLFQLLKLF